jgi:hypothetical protein
MKRPHRATPIHAFDALLVAAVLSAPQAAGAQASERGDERPSVAAEVVAASLKRSIEALSFRIAVEVPTGHHGYLDRGDDGFFIPISFSFPDVGRGGVVVETISAPSGVRDEGVRARVLRGRAEFALRLVPAPRTRGATTTELRYQLCNDLTRICYPPETLRILVARGTENR